jgi:hypothetical protein
MEFGASIDSAKSIESIEILREDLQIDLRPLVELRGNGVVRAVYTVINRGAAIRVPVMFASPGMQDTTYRVYIDGRRLASTRLYKRDERAGALWPVPGSTPLPDGQTLEYPGGRAPDGLEFELDLPAGIHRVSVEYRATLSGNLDENYLRWQFVYLLSPARDWKSLDTLNATVLIPANWIFAATPSFSKHSSGEYTATWYGIPSNAIALTTYANPPLEWDTYLYHAALLAAVIALMVIVARTTGKLFAARQFSARWRYPLAPILGFLIFYGYAFAFSAINEIPRIRADQQATPHYGYGGLFTLIGLLLIGWPTLSILFAFTFKRAYRKSREALLPSVS